MCIAEGNCAQFAKSPSSDAPAKSPPGPWVPPGGSASAPGVLSQGMQSQNCTTNPLWCTANQVVIAACDWSLCEYEYAPATPHRHNLIPRDISERACD